MITEKKRLALECLWEEAKAYSKLYYETDNEYQKHKYISHFRSPIFDETNIKAFQKDFTSIRALNGEGKITDEHCNGRTNCSKALIEKIYKKEITTLDQFITFLIDYCYTIKILSEENTKVAEYLKKNKDKNFIDAYNELGIVICDKDGNETNLLEELIVL